MEGDRASRDTHIHAHTRATRMEKEGEASITRGKRTEEKPGGVGGWKGLGRMRAGEEEKRTWKHTRRTRADVSIRGTGWHAGHACTYTRVSTYMRHTYIHMHAEREAGTSESARDTGVCDRD